MARARRSGQRVTAAVRAKAPTPAVPDIGTILIASIEERWGRFQAQLRRTRRSGSEGSVHDLRVAMRRLMATVDMIRTIIPDEGLQKTRRSLRRHLKGFNQLRDTHIQILALRRLAREFPPLRPLGTELRRREAKLVRASRGTIRSINPPHLERSLADASVRLGALLRLPGVRDVAGATAMGAMGAAFARAFELRQQVNPGDPASIHRLRVVFKKCRYMVEVLRPLLPGVDERFLKSLDAYQARMGEVQDMGVIMATVNSFTLNSRYAPTLSLVPVQQLLAQMRKDRIDEFLRHADELYGLWETARAEPGRPSSRAGVSRRSRRPGTGAGVSVRRRPRPAGARRHPATRPRS